MRYHDYHLKSYTVYDSGARIVITLSWSYPRVARPDSIVEFGDVTVYRFSHAASAIITDIGEVPLESSIETEVEFLSNAARQDGLSFWKTDFKAYSEYLRSNDYRFYEIRSAVGFSGFVIAKSVK